jgi:hypothetical protein
MCKINGKRKQEKVITITTQCHRRTDKHTNKQKDRQTISNRNRRTDWQKYRPTDKRSR